MGREDFPHKHMEAVPGSRETGPDACVCGREYDDPIHQSPFPIEPEERAPLPTEAPPLRILFTTQSGQHVLHFWGSDCEACGAISEDSWTCDVCIEPATPLYRFETNPW